MDATYLVESVRQEIVNHNLLVKALIQDIQQCTGPREVLNELNSEGRCKIALLKKHIEQLEDLAKDEDKQARKMELMQEVESHRQQLASTSAAFRKANIACILNIEKSNKEELFEESPRETQLRHRQKRDKEGLVKMSRDVTEQLLSISRRLAETTLHSSETLETLTSSSGNIHSTQDELQSMGSVIVQSGKLLAKYGRREFTDKILVLFAFAFFVACVLYIIRKRVF